MDDIYLWGVLHVIINSSSASNRKLQLLIDGDMVLSKWHAGTPQQDIPTLSTLTIVIVSASNDIICRPPPPLHPLEVIDCDVSGTCWHMRISVWVPKWRADISVISSAIHSPESITCASHLARWVHENTDYLETGSLGCCRQTELITKHVFWNGRFFGSRNAES